MTHYPRAPLIPDAFLALFEPKNQPSRRALTPPPLRYSQTLSTATHDVTLYYDDPAVLTVSADRQRFILFVGELYRPRSSHDGQTLLELYEQREIDFVNDVNGLFAAVVIDCQRGQILLATDRRKSRNLFVRWDGPTLIVSNSLYLQRPDEMKWDKVAAAELLTVGYSYLDHTLIAGVETLAMASVYRLDDGKLVRHPYWEFAYTLPDKPVPLAQLKHDFGDLMVEAVRRRLSADRPAYLSLSGGHDSRVIAGILSRYLRADVHLFSYQHGRRIRNSDEDLAARFAALCGYRHEMIESFDGDPLQVLTRNGHWGGGLSQPCDEVDAWVRLGARFAGGPKPVLFTGDTAMYKSRAELLTARAVLDSSAMFDFSAIGWLESMIDPVVYREMVAATRADLDQVLRRVPATDDLYALRDAVTGEQYTFRYIGHWRENFPNQFFHVTAPFMDNDVLDFLLQVPTAMRRAKFLYMETSKAMFPDLFRLPRATSASYDSYWTAALRQHHEALRAWITERSSPLDELIPPDVLLRLLDTDLTPRGKRAFFSRPLIKSAYRRVQRNPLAQLAVSQLRLMPEGMPKQKFLLRALTLRATLEVLFE